MGAPVNWHREDVKTAVRKRGATLSALGLRKRIHPSSMSHCLGRPLPAANTAIADFLGKPLIAIWPEWYDENGNRRSQPDASRTPGVAKRRNPEIAKRRTH